MFVAAATAAKSLQPCLTLCNPIDGRPPGSSVPGILQARILEWVAIFFSSVGMHSHVRLCATLWTAAHQAPLSTGFSRQEHWSGLPFSSLLLVLHTYYIYVYICIYIYIFNFLMITFYFKIILDLQKSCKDNAEVL